MLHGRFYTRFTKVLPRVQLVVSSAAQPKILNRPLATHRPRLHMVELQTPSRATPPPTWRDIAALLTIAKKHCAHDRCGDVTLSLRVRV
jgi:hypothetical protein